MPRIGNSYDFTSESEVLIGSSAPSPTDDWVLLGYTLVGLRLSGELIKLIVFSFWIDMFGCELLPVSFFFRRRLGRMPFAL